MEPWPLFIDLPNLVYIYMSSKSERTEVYGNFITAFIQQFLYRQYIFQTWKQLR